MWIARDKNGLIHIYKKKPIKTGYGWYSDGWIIPAPSYDFTEVKWEDKEPRELILKPIKEEYGFVNLYKDGSQMKVGWKIFPTKEEAEDNFKDKEKYITTTKIQLEEQL